MFLEWNHFGLVQPPVCMYFIYLFFANVAFHKRFHAREHNDIKTSRTHKFLDVFIVRSPVCLFIQYFF